jgi:hypothetical protein
MSGPQLVIKQQQSPWVIALWCFAAVLALAATFYSGRYLAIDEREQALDQVDWLQKKLDEYQQAYLTANENLIMQKQSAKVDNQSNQQLVDSIKSLQDTQRQLEEELTFYRGIMAPELDQQGLTIAKLDFNSSSQMTTFKLVLTQAGKQEQFLKGQVTVRFDGKLNGIAKTYLINELGSFSDKHFDFQFKYFQNIEGQIQLPQGFVAENVVVSAKTRGLRKNQSAEKSFQWNS